VRLPTLGRLTLPATGLLVGALAWGVMSAPAYAEVDNPEPVPATETDAVEAATSALDQVEGILDPAAPESADPSVGESRDLTLALRDLRLRQDDLPRAERARARALEARPPQAYGWTKEQTKAFGSVVVHWDLGKTTMAHVDDAGAVADHVLATYAAAGYRAPMSDGTAGGDARLDIYLVDFGAAGHPELYGFCDASELPAQNGPYNAPAYCAFDHDFASVPQRSWIENLKVTAAHELFHATQFAYDYTEDAWFMEATATWAEDEVYDEINDNRQYLAASPLRQPAQALDQFDASGRQYGEWIFFRYLSERFPEAQGELPVIVRKIWERADSSRGPRYDSYSIQAVSRELASRGTDLRRVYAQFGAANRQPGRHYEEGSSYPKARAARSWTFRPKRHDTHWQVAKVDHLATKTVQVKPSRSMKRWRLRVVVDLPNKKRGVAAIVTTYDKRGRPASRFVPVSKRGNGKALVTFNARKVSRVEVTLSNAGIRYRGCWRDMEHRYSCSGTPRDDNRPMRYRLIAVR
jgi:hypothetical protein